MLNEFNIIQRYFAKLGCCRDNVVLGIGDDAAILTIEPTQQLVYSVDTSNIGIHFPVDAKPIDIGYRTLAIALSDLAAMGAQPQWVSLALSLPAVDESWLAQFSEGFAELLQHYQCQLIGGDITRGPLSVSVQVFGSVIKGQALQRGGAEVGDVICVSGELGSAGFGLSQLLQNPTTSNVWTNHFYRPKPRIELGLLLSGQAHAAIDLSDGLVGDLSHILQTSDCGATIELTSLPIAPFLFDNLPKEEVYRLALSAGDDYELCFTIAENDLAKVQQHSDIPLTAIGKVTAESTLQWQEQGKSYIFNESAYQHFGESQ